MIKAIIFDMDGVLIDTPEHTWEIHNLLLADYGKNVSDREIPRYLGRSLRDQINLFKKNFNITIDEDGYMVEFKLQEKKFIEKVKRHEFLINLFKHLKERFLLAVATSSPTARALNILAQLGIKEYFDVIIGAEKVKEHKPDPGLFLKAAEQLKVNPEECIVVEDALNGIEAAKKGHMKVVALVSKFLTAQDLKDADIVINNLGELKASLEKISLG